MRPATSGARRRRASVVALVHYVRLQEAEFAAEEAGYTATRHQREVGTGYFDLVSMAITPHSATVALTGSTENEQFFQNH